MKRTLSIEPDGYGRNIWAVTVSGPGSEDTYRLFGTRTLPTPYIVCDAWSPDKILAEIQQLNPEDTVVLDDHCETRYLLAV